MVRLLYNDKLAPITSEIGFLKCSIGKAAYEFVRWQTPIRFAWGQYLDEQNITSGSLEDILRQLLPLTNSMRTRYLFVPTNSSWTAYFDNGYRGPDPSSVISVLAEMIGCLGVRAVWVPNTKKGRKGRYGAVIFTVYDKPNPILNIRRSICLVNDGNWSNKWDFETSGEPFTFEQTECYKARRKTDRFTPEMLDSYLKELGIDAFSENFYFATTKNPAKLISTKGKLVKKVAKYSLEEAQREH